jgi:hypothetical protein
MDVAFLLLIGALFASALALVELNDRVRGPS